MFLSGRHFPGFSHNFRKASCTREALDATVIHSQEQKMLEKEIAALPKRQRTALNLCFAEGLSNQDAAEVMGLKLKALQSLIMRAKATLKERLSAYL